MKKFFTFLKGIALGFVSIAIPGLSASTMGIELGVYYDMIEHISSFKKHLAASAVFLTFLALGYLLGSFGGAIAVSTVFKYFPIVMVLLIIGFVLGGIPKMSMDLKDGVKKPSCWITMVVILALLGLFSFLLTSGESVSLAKGEVDLAGYIWLPIIGFITASTLVVPGLDFAVVLLAIGYYDAITSTISNSVMPGLIGYSWMILGIYFAGYIFGCFVFSKIVKALISRYEIQTKFASFAFVAAAPIIIVKKAIIDNDEFFTTTPQIIVGAVLFVLGFIAMFQLLRKFDKDKKKRDNISVDANKELELNEKEAEVNE